METAEEYDDETYRILMEDEKHPFSGYKPIYIREKVQQLLDIKNRAMTICHDKSFGKKACPYCGWNHS